MNHGNFLNATKGSSPATSSQNPCSAVFVTSAPEMFLPGIADFIVMLRQLVAVLGLR
ncbi:MAG: hypothetical protein OJF47_001103 [Nitrospira sp.]|nr:MAG: hypothetical protein OJF47_001103 [Nitrospira sp.]